MSHQLLSFTSMVNIIQSVGCSRLGTFPLRLRYVFIAATITAASFIIINNGGELLLLSHNEVVNSWETRHTDSNRRDDRYTIRTEGCTIPGLEPFDPTVARYVKPPTNLKPCPHNASFLIANNDTHIWIEQNTIGSLSYTCCYSAFRRPNSIADIESPDVDDRVLYDDCMYFKDTIEAKHEFVRVSCKYNNEVIQEQYFLFAYKKPFITDPDDSSDIPQNNTAYNVIVLGIDAVSRLNFHRTMPTTLAYLKSKGAIELLGYNKVADNTFPNVIPMLMGIKESELKRTCLPNSRNTFDNCPWVWEWFKDAGYYTALGEDTARLGTFNYMKSGFSGTPADYYLRTFMVEAENHVGNNNDFNTKLCMGDKYFYQVLLDYIKALTKVLDTSKLFGFFWEVTLTHDYLNYPMAIDDSYREFLEELDRTRYLDKTIVMLVSDHGMRWGQIRSTKQGRLEERLPFVYILVPESFQDQNNLAYQNLKLNRHRLTTPFDIHATLSDLVDLSVLKDEKITSRSKSSYALQRGISLFLPIPSNRTCKTASIADHWCTCHTGTNIDASRQEARNASQHVVAHLNTLLRAHRVCAQLSLKEILEAREMLVGSPDKDEEGWREFFLVVRTTPGGGVFEATLRLNNHSQKYAVTGTVSRINLYGDQSRCVHDYNLKLYCYCN